MLRGTLIANPFGPCSDDTWDKVPLPARQDAWAGVIRARIRKSPFRLTADSQPTIAPAPRWACLQT